MGIEPEHRIKPCCSRSVLRSKVKMSKEEITTRERFCNRSRFIRQRLTRSSIIKCVSFIVIINLMSTMNTIPVTNLHATTTTVAEAWVQPQHPRFRHFPHSIAAPLSGRTKSKVARGYVADDKKSMHTETATQSHYSEEQTDPSIILQQKKPLDLKVLLIDNHDSYTYNLYQYISTMTIHPVKVIMNDAFPSWDAFVDSLGQSNTTAYDHFDCIILSPGPGQPSHAGDMGIVLETIRRNSNIPILGVCLGHQALGYVYGHEVKLSPCGPVHGLMSTISHDEVAGVARSEQSLVCELFRDLPEDFEVVRYHSLVVDMPDRGVDDAEIEPIAWCDSLKETGGSRMQPLHQSDARICMGLRHKRFPHYGVQFHPESIGTGYAGYRILRNFCDFAHQYKAHSHYNSVGAPLEHIHEEDGILGNSGIPDKQNPSTSSKYRILIHHIDGEDLPLPKDVFEELYGSQRNSFWLDSSTANRSSSEGGCPIASNSRFSILGSNDGPLSRKIEYFGQEHDPEQRGIRVVDGSGKVDNMPEEDVLTYLRRKIEDEREIADRFDMVSFAEGFSDDDLSGYSVETIDEFDNQAAGEQVPFDYRGGYVGYLGYEVRHDTQCRIFEQEGGLGCGATTLGSSCDDVASTSGRANPNVPTSAFLFADRSLLYDHSTGHWYLVGVARNSDGLKDAHELDATKTSHRDTISWMRKVKSSITSMTIVTAIDTSPMNNPVHADVSFVPNRPKEKYQMDIARSHTEILNGESYELCVTNQLEADIILPKDSWKTSHESPLRLYRLLREKNPAPFSAFMNFYANSNESDSRGPAGSLSICCSSPERFLSVNKSQHIANGVDGAGTIHERVDKRQFVVESKPIKGTAARYIKSSSGIEELDDMAKQADSQIARRLQESVKDRAENLMIVDLLRNDLGRVCEVGSVHVPKLMDIESFATVHQLVSTIRGTIDDSNNAIDVIEACFPGGSMTGAPKQRSMEILDEIEEGVSRGPYSGSLGYISLNGCMDMNIVIRSAVLTPADDRAYNMNSETESWKVTIGCGGAITALSISDDEYEEMLLKSRVVREAICEWVAST